MAFAVRFGATTPSSRHSMERGGILGRMSAEVRNHEDAYTICTVPTPARSRLGSTMSGDEERLLAGRYLLVEQLGRGGMGTVWRAQDQVLGREVAVKELRVSGLPREELAVLHARMQQEARAAARVKHPGVVTVFDVLEEDGRPWIVMELIDGQSLADVIAMEGTLLPRDAAKLGAQLLSALDRAHQLGVLHRDVKPSNVLLERGGRVVLTDFGIAVMGGSSGLTRTGDVVGSPDYLAPERATGHRPGPESDLWSLGVTLYAAVEGQSPFRRTTTMSTLQAVVAEELPEPRHAGPLAPVIEALLHKDPNERATAEQARRMLDDVAAGLPVSPPARGAAEHPPTQVALPTDNADKERFAREPTQTTPATPVPSYGLGNRAEPGPAAYDENRAATPPTTRVPSADHNDHPGGAGDGRRRHRKSLLIAAALAVALVGGGAAAVVMTSDSRDTTQPAPAVSQSTVTSRSTVTSQSTVTRTATQSPRSKAGETPAPAQSSPASTSAPPTTTTAPAQQVVENYFAAINARDYARAWNLGGKNLGGSYDSYVKGFSTTVSDTVTVEAVSGETVAMHLDALQTDGTHQSFAGTYTVRHGTIVAANIHKQ
ncbi:serine/threonine-protein kinase [Streptomyces sp. NPDC007896]|uniref:serine/threonine-protein kinase n=1 Tax=Streptomyces sp. NPDC007896 TaxID=3364784 RepID=UPI0036EC78AE